MMTVSVKNDIHHFLKTTRYFALRETILSVTYLYSYFRPTPWTVFIEIYLCEWRPEDGQLDQGVSG